MNMIKFSGVALVLASTTVFTTSTLANAQNGPRIVLPRTCSNGVINRGGISNDPSKAVEKALIAWNRLARQRGFFAFKAAKNPRVKVVVYPSNNQNEVIWKANVMAYPCQFMDLGRR